MFYTYWLTPAFGERIAYKRNEKCPCCDASKSCQYTHRYGQTVTPPRKRHGIAAQTAYQPQQSARGMSGHVCVLAKLDSDALPGKCAHLKLLCRRHKRLRRGKLSFFFLSSLASMTSRSCGKKDWSGDDCALWRTFSSKKDAADVISITRPNVLSLLLIFVK